MFLLVDLVTRRGLRNDVDDEEEEEEVFRREAASPSFNFCRFEGVSSFVLVLVVVVVVVVVVLVVVVAVSLEGLDAMSSR